MKYLYSMFASILISTPFVYAQSGSLSQINNANDLVKRLVSIGNVAVYILVAFAVLYIVYTTVIYFIKGKEGDESRREAGMRILWGVIGLFVIVSIWGLVNILLNTLRTNNTVPADRIPNANFLNNSSANYRTGDPAGELNL